jgi:hypothetical protein
VDENVLRRLCTKQTSSAPGLSFLTLIPTKRLVMPTYVSRASWCRIFEKISGISDENLSAEMIAGQWVVRESERAQKSVASACFRHLPDSAHQRLFVTIPATTILSASTLYIAHTGTPIHIQGQGFTREYREYIYIIFSSSYGTRTISIMCLLVLGPIRRMYDAIILQIKKLSA